MKPFNYTAAASVDEAVSVMNTTPRASYVAGGTNIIDLWKYNIVQPDMLIDVAKAVGEEDAVRELPDGSVALNAFGTNADTAYHPIIESRYPLLSKAILAGASAQIRNMATNGGNLLQRTRCYYFYDTATPCNKRSPGSGCSAIGGHNRMMAILGTSEHCIAVFPSDMCVALAALNAEVHVQSATGQRVIPFEDFHRLPGSLPEKDNNLQPGELITQIVLPPDAFNQHYSYLKLRDRNSYAFALVSVATAFEMDGNVIKQARLALGGVAHKPWRVVAAEYFLQGKPAISEHFATAADIILEGAIGFEHNAFKIPLAKKAIIRNCHMALQPETQLPGAQPSL